MVQLHQVTSMVQLHQVAFAAGVSKTWTRSRGRGRGLFFLITFFSLDFFFYVFFQNQVPISRNLHQQCIVTTFLGV